MKLNLTKDIVVFDLETTGLSCAKDKIIQIAILKIFADGRPNETKVRYVNPEMPIPAKVTEITRITDEMVKDAPTFSKLAKGILSFIGDSDLCGFNSARFDLPLLCQEFYRAGIEFDMTNRKHVDVKRLFHRMEPRDLRAAYRKFIGGEIENAHDAGSDVTATFEVLEAMLDAYNGVDCIEKDDKIIASPVVNDIEALHEFTKNYGELDYEGWIKQNEDGKIVFGKGKYQDQELVPMLLQDKNYYDWIMFKGDFTQDTRKKMALLVNNYKESLATRN